MPSIHNIGDLRNLLSQFLSELRKVKYNGHVDHRSLCAGIASVYLPYLHYILLECYPDVTQYISDHGYNLRGKKDRGFMEVLYKLLRDEFQYKPVLSRDQFFHLGFAARKLVFLTDVFCMVQEMHKTLAAKCKSKACSESPEPWVPPEPSSPPRKTASLSDPEEKGEEGGNIPPNLTKLLAYVQSSLSTLESTLDVFETRLARIEGDQTQLDQHYHRVLEERDALQHQCLSLQKELQATSKSSPARSPSPTRLQPNRPDFVSELPTSLKGASPDPPSTSLPELQVVHEKIQQAQKLKDQIQHRLLQTQRLLHKAATHSAVGVS